MLVVTVGCPAGGGSIGQVCIGNDDCDGTLQCLTGRCIPHCQRAPDCGDGYACDAHGICQAATGRSGADCTSEVDCATGFSCQISDTLDASNHLRTTCTEQVPGRTPGSECRDVNDCLSGTCALGHCVDLCNTSRDCAPAHSCVTIPHLPLPTAAFSGCLPSSGSLSWDIPVSSPASEVLVAVPVVARSIELVMTVNDRSQRVGASAVLVQNEGTRLYSVPCSMTEREPCGLVDALSEFYERPIRHMPGFGQSVLLIPSSGSMGPIGPNVYRVDVSSFRANNAPGSAIPRVTAVVKLSAGQILDLHFYFLDLADQACVVAANRGALNARTAPQSSPFQDSYVPELKAIFERAGLTVVTKSYADILDRPKLDSLDVADAGELLSLGAHPTGINVFFVRSLSPAGLQAFGPNPGPAGLARTRQSGIVLSLDTLCYRDWTHLARITAHEIARYMGLYHNVELERKRFRTWRDLIDDNDGSEADDPNNLMFFSEFGGSDLSRGQAEILKRSPVLQ
jgi:hypothetical protein